MRLITRVYSITAEQHDLGYVQGTNVIRVCISEGLDELWALLRKPHAKQCGTMV